MKLARKCFILFLIGVLAFGCSANSIEPTSTPLDNTLNEAPTQGPVPTIKPLDPNSTPGLIVIVNGTLIDGTGAEPIPNGVVVIENGVIVMVGDASEVEIPENAQVIDAMDGTILPGLIDTHTHLLNEIKLDEGSIPSLTVNLFLTRTFRSGITTFRDAGSQIGLSIELGEFRDAIKALDNRSPRIVYAGPILAAPGGVAATFFSNNTLVVEDENAASQAVYSLSVNGVDAIKIYVDTEWQGDGYPNLTGEQIRTITDSAHQSGLPVFAHVTSEAEAWTAINNNADELTHWPGGDQLSQELIDVIVIQAIPVGSTFTFAPYEGDVRRLLDAGGHILLSSDMPSTMSPAEVYKELELMVQYGMTPEEVIMASTSWAAMALGLEDQIGSIEVGKQADIIIVAGNPLDDIRVMRYVSVVLRGGEIVIPSGK